MNTKHIHQNNIIYWVKVMVLNATFNNISAISWRLVLLVEETEYTYKTTKSVNNRKTVKTVMTLTWYRHF
jgi:hypothetical protein